MLQFSFPNDKVVVASLTAMGIFDPELFPPALKDLLELPNIVACGQNIGVD